MAEAASEKQKITSRPVGHAALQQLRQ